MSSSIFLETKSTAWAHINIFMNKFIATVRVKAKAIRTAVFADSQLHAKLILEYQFGIGSVIQAPKLANGTNEDEELIDEVIATIKPIKPLTPAQSKIDNLKRQKDMANKNLKAERDRQKIAKAQATIRQASSF